MWGGTVFVILISLVTVVRSQQSFPKVKTEFGLHKGIWDETFGGHRIASYLGIPYAKPPIGNLRFQKPSPWTKEWRRPRDSTRLPSPCLPSGGSDDGSEDCLYLNIFTPQVEQNPVREANDSLPPVLVFLIGSFDGKNDNNLYSPDYLLDQDIVLVTVNYRYGYFGFFTTGDEVAPGNYGLKDVLEALKWLQRNIAAFGGDPDNVTLMGQGIGAGIVHLLALSDKSEGLFHKYITQSGAAQAAWSYRPMKMAKNMSMQFASSVNCTQDSSQKIVECLRLIPASVRADVDIFPIVSPWESYGPTDEPESDDAVITENPRTLMKNGAVRDIPWLTGVVGDEALLLTLDLAMNSSWCDDLAEHFEDIVFELANVRNIINDPSYYVRDLAVFYFDGNLTVDCAESFTEMVGDMLVNWPVYEALISQAENMESDVYFYNFIYQGTFTKSFEYDDSERFGVCHGDEMNYLFPVLNNFFDTWKLSNTVYDQTMINIVTEMWTNFAKTGIPSARFSAEWKPYRDGKGYMEFGHQADISMQENFLSDRMAFWYNLTERQFPEDQNNNDDGEIGAATSLHMKNFHIFQYPLGLSFLLLTSKLLAP